MSRVAARCPSCQSVFFVSAAQGKVANNLVRCGRCGHLFNVLENISNTLPEPEVATSPPESEEDAGLEPEFATEGSARESVAGAVAEPDEFNGRTDADEGEGESASQGVAALGDTPAPAFDLSNLATPLPDDFEFDNAQAKNSGPGRRLSLALLIIIVALAGLGVQFVFFNVPSLSQQLAYRPWLQRFCGVLPCELEPYSDRGLIRVEGLRVHAHPDLEGSLMIELVLINMASLEQAYPPLILRFDDLGGEQVAARRLSAEDYLPRSISADRPMPVDKAVSIKLAILDPGERALSYSVFVAQ